MFVFLLPPVGYGWGYRGWGAPYPRYFQRRRAAAYANTGGATAFDHNAWGWGGDFVWLVIMVGAVWAMMAFWRR